MGDKNLERGCACDYQQRITPLYLVSVGNTPVG
nr:MAG TPA: hypothetical protein [Bacteriophage sp.]